MSNRNTSFSPAEQKLFVQSSKLQTMRPAPIRIEWKEPPVNPLASVRADLVSCIDFSLLNEIFENFLEITGLLIAVIDLEGNVLSSSRWQRLCIEFHRANPNTLACCVRSDTVLSQQMEDGTDYAIYRCANGLIDCATPIVIEGVHVANLFTGQFLLEAPDKDYFERQQALFGFDKEAYFEALSEIPIVSEQKIPAILKLLKGLAQQIARQSLAEKRALAALANVEKQVAERTAELTAANQELEAFTFATSHDLKGPLGRINNFSILLEKRFRDRLDGDGLMFLDLIRQNSTRLSQLVDDLLSHARFTRQALELEKIDIAAAVAAVLREKASDLEESRTAVRVDVPQAWVLADATSLSRALSNLLENALKYSSEATAPLIEIGGLQSGSHFRLWVRDNGIGFKMEYHDKIFELFRRLHTYAEYSGSGVGLALVKRAMERMGGKVWAESAPGQGSTFFLELQAAPSSG